MCFTLSPWFLFLRDGIQIQKKAKPRDCSQSTRIFCSSSTYVCNCKIKLGFVSTCKMTKTEWVDSWQQPRCYSQWHWKWHLLAILWCRSQISNKGTQSTSHLRLLLGCLDHRLAKIVGKIYRKDVLSTGPRSNPLFDGTKGLHRFQNFLSRY